MCIEIKKERNKDKIFKFEKCVSDAVATEIKTSNYKEMSRQLFKLFKLSNVSLVSLHKRDHDITDFNKLSNYQCSLSANMNKYAPNFLIFSPQICLVFNEATPLTCSALVTLTDYWRVSRNNKKEAGVIAIDLSNAFASICHNLLLAKLKANGSFVPF